MTASTSMAAPLRRGSALRGGGAFMAVLLGVAMTLALRGYQFGSGNHAVYLIAPLREVHPELLKNDWWATHTLQYHWAFTQVAAGLMRVHLVGPVFLAFYLGLVGLLHVGWLRMVRGIAFDVALLKSSNNVHPEREKDRSRARVPAKDLAYDSRTRSFAGSRFERIRLWSLRMTHRQRFSAEPFDVRVYLLSVVLYYLSAGGVGLGSYQFLQDSSFLPGNVANIAMLWGVVYWIEKRGMAAACCLALAGFFHLNHALVGLMFWPLGVFCFWREERQGQDSRETSAAKALLQWGVILLAGLPNILPALRASFAGGVKMRLGEFVELYVHLRHPHHYDPLAWPVALWVSFLWPIPLFFFAQIGGRGRFVFWFFMALQLIALIFAGIFFIWEPLIQMSLFRFSIYAKILSCIGAAAVFLRLGARRPGAFAGILSNLPWLLLLAIFIMYSTWSTSAAGGFVRGNLAPLLIFTAILMAGCVVIVWPRLLFSFTAVIGAAVLISIVLLTQWNHLGLRLALLDDEDASYLAVCDYAREHTQIDAIFIVPPNEQIFRNRAQRAIVVNFKNVPQLSSEMPQWKERLETVLGQPLSELPHRFDLAHAAIARIYDSRRTSELVRAARRYGASYLVTTQALPDRRAVFENARYHLYAADSSLQGETHDASAVTGEGANAARLAHR